MGETTNLKITWPADLKLAQAILEVRDAHRSGI
jgi:2-C-methyl-D-erythritol 4-phosphate cytidylyltransferase